MPVRGQLGHLIFLFACTGVEVYFEAWGELKEGICYVTSFLSMSRRCTGGGDKVRMSLWSGYGVFTCARRGGIAEGNALGSAVGP